jgi:release factor glutamine methyltransferase
MGHVPPDSAKSEPWTITRLLAWTTPFLKQRDIDSPRLSAEILLAHALKCDRIELYTRHDAVPDQSALGSFRENVRKASEGAPIAYLIGYKEFYSARFTVNEHVLIPRPETEMLVERTISLARNSTEPVHRILEIGAGSGCIAICIALHLPGAQVSASDISGEALAVAQQNAEQHGVIDRIDFRQGDLFAPWDGHEPFDVIVSNPPYIAQADAARLPANVRDFEPATALFAGDDGLSVLRSLIGGAPARLRDNGHLLTEMAFDQAAGVRNLLDASVWGDIVTYKDMAQHERVLHARRLAAGSTQVA